jgi:hypothetical protein
LNVALSPWISKLRSTTSPMMRLKELLRKCQVKTRNALYCLRRVLEAWTGHEHTCSDVGWNGLIFGIQLEELKVRYLLATVPKPQTVTSKTGRSRRNPGTPRPSEQPEGHPTRRVQKLLEIGWLSRAARAFTNPTPPVGDSANILAEVKGRHPIEESRTNGVEMTCYPRFLRCRDEIDWPELRNPTRCLHRSVQARPSIYERCVQLKPRPR